MQIRKVAVIYRKDLRYLFLWQTGEERQILEEGMRLRDDATCSFSTIDFMRLYGQVKAKSEPGSVP